MAFSGASILFYDVPAGGVWGKLGFGVPNWGTRLISRNMVLIKLVKVIGRNLQAIMLSDDALTTKPPQIDTIRTMIQLLVRARTILTSEGLPDAQAPLRGVKGVNDKESFLVFPTPIFKVRNPWMEYFAKLVMHSLAEALQNSENSTATFEISATTALTINAPLTRVMKLIATELLMIPANDPSIPVDPTTKLPIWEMFVPSATQINAYNPTAWFTQTERVDVAYPEGDEPSDYDLTLLTNGIPIVNLPPLTAYPVTIPDSAVDSEPDPATLAQPQSPNPAATGAAAAALGAQNSLLLPAGVTAPSSSAVAAVASSTGTSILSNPAKLS